MKKLGILRDIIKDELDIELKKAVSDENYKLAARIKGNIESKNFDLKKEEGANEIIIRSFKRLAERIIKP